MDNCIFCKIVKGDIPSSVVYEDDSFKAIMDISPASKGHVIIIAKEHAANIFELSDDMACKVFLVAKKIAKAVEMELGCDGVNILQNNGEVAGQTVFHFHMHVIPRYKDDSINIKWPQQETNISDISELADKIASRI